jgi:hypothetical protein
MKTLNPLNVIKKRKLNTMPRHFSKVKIQDFDLSQGKLENWITAKLNGRYSVVKIPTVVDSNGISLSMFIGFENHSELTYFMLACPHFRRI